MVDGEATAIICAQMLSDDLIFNCKDENKNMVFYPQELKSEKVGEEE